MEQDIKNEFEFLAKAIKEGFDHLEATMATKDELRELESRMATKSDLEQLRTATVDGFASQQLEIRSVQEKLTVLDDKMEKLYRMESEDMRVLDLDMKKVKQRLALT